MNRIKRISAHLSSNKKFSCIETEIIGRVCIIRLNRPRSLNALNDVLMGEVGEVCENMSNNENISCIILTGNGRAFAAGADITEMVNSDYYHMSTHDKILPWEKISKCNIPIIAAVNGFALGGGCEIAMMCDIIIASSKAKFGQPEIKIGTIPGAGGTQRLIRAVGKSKAMELVLTGNMMTANEACERGLVSYVVEPNELMNKAMEIANSIAEKSRPVVVLAKECVNAANNTTLDQGIRFERRVFHSTFGLNDRKEGMKAFVEKRKANYKHQ